jgi:hypothetical protein
LVGIFDEGPDVVAADVDAQEHFFQDWLGSCAAEHDWNPAASRSAARHCRYKKALRSREGAQRRCASPTVSANSGDDDARDAGGRDIGGAVRS